jgi:hypothetical protein
MLSGLAAVAQEAPAEKLSALRGSARESRTRLVVGANVLVTPQGDASRIYLTTTDEKGRFQVAGLSDGDYDVLIARDGYRSERKTGVALKFPFRAVVEVGMEPGNDPPVALPASSGSASAVPLQLKVDVTGPDGAPIEEVEIRLVRVNGTLDPIGLRTPASGSVTLDSLASGQWRLEVLGVGYLPLRQRVSLADSTTSTVVKVRLAAQPPNYQPAPLDLMPPEVPIIPEGFAR